MTEVMAVGTAELAEFTAETIRVMLNREFVELPEAFTDPAGPTSVVHISGDAQLSVQLVSSRGFAEQATATLFDLPVAELDDESIADTLGELANVVGGAVKAMSGMRCQLSLPTVTLDGATHLPGAVITEAVTLTDGSEWITAQIWKTDHEEDGPAR